MSDQNRDAASAPEEPDDHLSDLDDGAGCTEIWEHLSEKRESESEPDGE